MNTTLLTCAILAATAFLPLVCHSPSNQEAAGCESCAGCADCEGEDWQTLWDGESMAGWSMCGPGEFQIEDGALKATGGMGMLWYSDASFRDFTLRLQWKVEHETDNSGVFVRFPDPGDDPWIAVNQGYELQICDEAPEKHNTGSIYSFQGSTSMPTRAIGEWNDYEISVIDQHYTIKVNGQLVNEFDGERSREGYFGMQNHDDGSPVRFRNIRIQRRES